MEQSARGRQKSAQLTFKRCPECSGDVFNLTTNRELKCIKCGHLLRPPRNFNIVSRKGNFYPHK
jgi:DNA-directed RNA polymerase subunit RPC12/RpoP